MKIDWKKKLANKKVWAGVTTVVAAVLAAFAVPELTIEQIVAAVGAVGLLVMILLEDDSKDTNTSTPQTETKPEEDTPETK